MVEPGLARGQEFLAAAQASFQAGRFNVAFEEARTSAELACKLLIQRDGGPWSKGHNPIAEMTQRRLVPAGVSARALSRVLGDASRGAYGFGEPVSRVEAKEALVLAQGLLATLGDKPTN